ncbi:MAG: DNA-protecting protein DprA [Bacteroidetes bacterium]|nr:DNA-protecting protein DprA [Bacteroidota bacterium]
MKEISDDVFINRIALTLIEGVGDILARQLISYCGSVEAVFKEKKRALEKIPEIGPVTAKSIAGFKEFDRAGKELVFIRKHKIQTFFYLDENYPKRLKNCHDSPVLLYYKGTSDLNKSRMVAIVGTRKASQYGKDVTEELVTALGQMEATIVSGLAYGIDITAHRACVDQHIETIGVMAHGIDRIYPPTHDGIARKMILHGGLITEHISGSEPEKENFPKRNRIIAGLCDAIIVTEAARKGGALITAEIANNYNRDVFAVPGRIKDTYSEGCNLLIRNNKAVLLQSAADISYIMGWEDDSKLKKKVIQKSLFVELTEEEQLVTGIIRQNQTCHIDLLSFQSGMTPGKLSTLLLKLEFAGLIRCLPGKVFQLC